MSCDKSQPCVSAVGRDYVMINSCEIRNFRCFKKVKVTGMKRFTLLVGGSGSGKTAFLEALFLAGGSNPEIYFRIRRWRGFAEKGFELSGTRKSFETLFRDMFYEFDHAAGIDIRLTDSDRGWRSVQVTYEKKETLGIPMKGEPDNVFLISPISFTWENPQKVMKTQIEIKDGAVRMTGSGDVFPLVLVSPQTISARDNAEKYSELSKQKKADPVLEQLQKIFPEVQDITLENVLGDSMLHISLEGLKERLPVVDLSAGINKYLSIVLAILVNPGGTVLVDEIENGFYYANLTVLLRSIVELCEKYNVQIIATTHSYEFLQSLIPIMDEISRGERDFSLLRFERHPEQPVITLIEGSTYKAAIEESFEIR